MQNNRCTKGSSGLCLRQSSATGTSKLHISANHAVQAKLVVSVSFLFSFLWKHTSSKFAMTSGCQLEPSTGSPCCRHLRRHRCLSLAGLWPCCKNCPWLCMSALWAPWNVCQRAAAGTPDVLGVCCLSGCCVPSWDSGCYRGPVERGEGGRWSSGHC